jgi:hypothetical protein
MTRPVMVMLDLTVTAQDLARALQFSGLSLSSTHQPNLLVVRQTPRPPPRLGVVTHLPPFPANENFREGTRVDPLRDRKDKS